MTHGHSQYDGLGHPSGAGADTRTTAGRQRLTPAWALIVLALLGGCVIGKRALRAPEGDDAAILLVTTEMPEPIADIARHAWLAVRDRGSTRWERIEVGYFGNDPFEGVSGVMLHAVWRGAAAERAIPCLREQQDRHRPGRRYLPWPGPNSNTFIEALLRGCDLRADLPATAIGRDHRGLIGVSLTSGGTGVQLETPIVGLKLGLKEGIEIHFFALAFGIDLWPPAIIVPFGPGRLGFDDR
jgi:hypothetical protein